MNLQNNVAECQIALIGDTQSGKTTLVAGLAKTSNREFTVGLTDERTRSCLAQAVASIEGGRWPEPNLGRDIDLSFTLNLSGGRQSLVSFKEYMGEHLREPAYIEQTVGKPDGALILLSPGMGGLRDADSARTLIFNLKHIIDHLKTVKCTAIALVVTAHDRLSTDLAGFATEFEAYLSEIEDYLRTSHVQWRRFDVTITGRLADQHKPSFAADAENTARKPFVWLVDRIRAKRNHHWLRKLLRGVALSVAALAVVATIGVGWAFYKEKKTVDGYETAKKGAAFLADGASEGANPESDLKKATKKLYDALSVAKTNTFWFSAIESRRTNFVYNAKTEYDEMKSKYLHVKINKKVEQPTGLTEDECQKIDAEIKRFEPTQSSLKDIVTNLWAEVRPQIRKKSDKSQYETLKENLGEAETANALKALKEIRDKIEQWKVTNEYAFSKTNLLKDVASKYVDCDRRDLMGELLMRKLEEKGYEDIVKTLGRVRAFDEVHTDAPPDAVQEMTNELHTAEEDFLKLFSDRFSQAWAPKSRKRPVLSQNDEKFIKFALDVPDLQNKDAKLSVRFLEELKKKCKNAEKEWEAAKKREVDDFINKEIRMERSAADVFDVYKSNYEAGLRIVENPFVANVDQRVFQVVTNFFDQYIGEVRKGFLENGSAFNSTDGCRKACDRFTQFQKLCLALNKAACGLTNTWCEAFARDCRDHGIDGGMNKAFAQHLTITQIDVKVSEDGSYNNYLGGKFGLWFERHGLKEMRLEECLNETYLKADDQPDYVVKVKDVYKTIYNKTIKVFLNPWTRTQLGFYATLDIKGTFSTATACISSLFRLEPRRSAYKGGSIERECKCKYGNQSYTCTIIIHCTFEGPDLFETYEEHRTGGKR